jgi:hypothetical protein
MASTYVNDLRLNEMGTGDGSGTWGTTTNVNLELIGEAMGYGTEAVANASTHTITMADGATDGFRCTFLRLTGGGQICTVTLAPNTLSHTWIIRNTTGFALTFTQGSGANVIIAAGMAKIVTTDGLGAGAVVYECLYDLELGGKLDVSGAVNFSDDATYAAGADIITASLGANNVRIGAGAGDSITVGGDSNVVVGTNAGTAITTGAGNVAVGHAALDANTTADSNVAVGYGALGANTTGENNVAVGHAALDANTTADSNTAVGYSALTANTTGTNNIAVGNSALAANTTANNNVAMGHNALTANTTGAANIAVGYNALDANTTANNNTAVGYSALGANTTANSNTAVGYFALSANTTGASNVAVGYLALDANTTASNNVAMGQSALSANTTGQYNVALGFGAGYSTTTATQLTTGDGNVFLGFRASGTVATQDYGTAIGYTVAGAAGYTTVGQSSSDIRAAHGVATWATVSDERYKKDIVDSTAGLAFVNALRPRTFKYRTLGELPETFRAYESGSTEVFKNSDTNHGFIAQEVKAAIDADSSIKDGFRLWDDREDGSQEVAEAALIPVLTRAIQELSAQVTALTARLAILEG